MLWSGTDVRADDPRDEPDALRAVLANVDRKPPAGWAAVRAFEAAHAIELPAPFRGFLATVSDGCPAGPPAYGLSGLGALTGPEADATLARPFPLTSARFWDEETGPAKGDGTVHLGTDGCAMDWRLVVTGEHRGHVWQFTDVGAQPFGRPFGYTTAEPGFGGWLRHWAAGRDWFDAD
ncbi:hypothetical protein Airi01_073440 [Actinoallomurus iriomotensis]|uniref:Knr4/Smi1-like domain-containing protein n=1 Tax=Actinoallomurus iriomotensis TaxID=478107 RepID=A0A9W6RRZ0_9ACTN|nr:hypothetical protein Airi01_073440 [Actinoallomurus iriomotensis]